MESDDNSTRIMASSVSVRCVLLQIAAEHRFRFDVSLAAFNAEPVIFSPGQMHQDSVLACGVDVIALARLSPCNE